MARGDLFDEDFNSGTLAAWTATSGSPVLTTESPIEGTHALRTTTNAHVTRNINTQLHAWVLFYIRIDGAATGTRNCFAVRTAAGELASVRVTTDNRVRFQHASTVIADSEPLELGTVHRVEIHTDYTGDRIDFWLTEGNAERGDPLGTSLADQAGGAYAVRVGGLNSGHDGIQVIDYIQVATTDILTPLEDPAPEGTDAVGSRLHLGMGVRL